MQQMSPSEFVEAGSAAVGRESAVTILAGLLSTRLAFEPLCPQTFAAFVERSLCGFAFPHGSLSVGPTFNKPRLALFSGWNSGRTGGETVGHAGTTRKFPESCL